MTEVSCEVCGAATEAPAVGEAPQLTGRWAQFAQPPVVCAGCVERERAERDALELRRAASIVNLRLDRACIPDRLGAVGLDALDDRHPVAIDAARRWAAGELRGLLLGGPFGTGKSTIAAAALRRLLARRSGRFVSAPDLLARLGAGFDDDERQWATQTLTGRDALVLDDIDKARPSAYGAEQIFAAVDGRYAAGSPLLVTTNLTGSELAAWFGDPYGGALVSRLVGYCEAIRLDGRDRRLEQRRTTTAAGAARTRGETTDA